MRTRSPELLLLLLCTVVLLGIVPPPLAAQSPPRWTIDGGRAEATVAEDRSNGHPAIPLSALVGLGAEIASTGDGHHLHIGGHSYHFRVGIPFVVTGDRLHELSTPVYSRSGVVFVPVEFLTDVLAAPDGPGVPVDGVRRTIRRPPPREAVPAAPPIVQAAHPIAAVRPLVVIDAGHGGVDPGARGRHGAREKDVTLAVARKLAALLKVNPDLEVRMTRDRDTLIALRDRSRRANLWRGEESRPALFLSIHCNASESRSAEGFETYFLSEAKTDDARRVAQMENAAQKYEDPGASALDPLSFIMHDLRQNKYLRDSSEWADMIQARLDGVLRGTNRGVKQAGFVVLNGAFMPAVLVEIGFISNPTEERLLTDSEQQERIAAQLARAVDDFLRRDAGVRVATGG